MNDESTRAASIQLTPKLILGVAILAAGVIFTLDNLGLVDASYVLDFWPLILVAIGATKLKDAGRTGAWISGSLWIAAGVLWILHNLAVVDVHPLELWPILLIFAGYMLVRRALKPRAAREDSDDGHRLSGVACLSGVSRRSSSKAFRGGDFTAVMGGCEVDLRDAEIQGEAIVDVFAFWGGVEIKVPYEFTVDSEVTAILGGFDDKTRQDCADPNQRLVLRGIAMMGGVEVHN